jgi:hypothetical protein
MKGSGAMKDKWVSTEEELVRLELVALASEVATLAWRASDRIERAGLAAEGADLLEECAGLDWTARELLARQGIFQKGSRGTLEGATEVFRACLHEARDVLQRAEALVVAAQSAAVFRAAHGGDEG